MTTKVTLTCAGCQRTVQLLRTALVARLAEGKPMRCTYCARELSIPAEVRADGRPQKQTSVTGRCPGCLRPARVVGEGDRYTGTCVHCALRFHSPGPGRGSFDFPAQQPAAADEVEAVVAPLASMPAGGLLRSALRRRQQAGALEAGEAPALVGMLTALQGWRAVSPEGELPLPPLEVLHLLGPLVLDAQFATIDEARRCVRLTNSMVLDAPTATGPQLGLGSKVALNTLGVGLLLATGTGFTVSGGGEAPQPEYLSRVMDLFADPVPGGSRLRGEVSENGSSVTPLARHELVGIVQRAFERRERLSRYLRLRCLCGTAVRGATAKGLSREGLAERLVEVGASRQEAQRLLAAFVVA